jgi:hypothetical protein
LFLYYLSLDTSVFSDSGSTTVKFHELESVDLGSLQNLDSADKNVLQGVDALAFLLDLLANGTVAFGEDLLEELLNVAVVGLTSHNFEHLSSDLANLSSLSVRGLGDLVLSLLGEADREKTNGEAISSLNVDKGLDEGLPFADQRLELVGGEAHAVQVGEALLTLDILNEQVNGLVVELFVVVQVSQRDLEDATLQSVNGVLGSDSLVNNSLADGASVEHSGSVDIVPFLSGKRIDNLFLGTLLRLSLILTNGHCVK